MNNQHCRAALPVTEPIPIQELDADLRAWRASMKPIPRERAPAPGVLLALTIYQLIWLMKVAALLEDGGCSLEGGEIDEDCYPDELHTILEIVEMNDATHHSGDGPGGDGPGGDGPGGDGPGDTFVEKVFVADDEPLDFLVERVFTNDDREVVRVEFKAEARPASAATPEARRLSWLGALLIGAAVLASVVLPGGPLLDLWPQKISTAFSGAPVIWLSAGIAIVGMASGLVIMVTRGGDRSND